MSFVSCSSSALCLAKTASIIRRSSSLKWLKSGMSGATGAPTAAAATAGIERRCCCCCGCCCCVDCALAAFGFFGQHVATKGAAAGKFASACHLDALGSTLMGLEFWHLFTPYYDTQIASSHLRLLFDNCFIFKEASDFFNQLVSNLFMGHLASFVDYL